MDLIDRKVGVKQRKRKFQLQIPYQQVKRHMANIQLEGSSLLDFEKIERNKRGLAPTYSHNLRYKKSPSVVPCNARLNENYVP